MRHMLNRRAVVSAFAVLLLLPVPAVSQETSSIPMPIVEVSAGYTFMRDFDEEDINFPAGWYAAGAVNLNHWLGIVGEVTGSYKNGFEMRLESLTFSNDARVYTFMGGPRFSAKQGRVVPYAQVLAGGAHRRLTTAFPEELASEGLIGSVTVNSTDFALQPGGGVTFLVTEHLGLRVAADYRLIVDFDEDENEYSNELRFLTGFTLNWGAR